MNIKGVLLALLAFGIFSTHDVVVKFLGGSYSPVQIIFFSSLFSFPLIVVMLLTDGEGGSLRPVYPSWVLLRTIGSVVSVLCAFYAFSSIPMAQTYAILFASPMIITLLSIPILGERVGVHRGLAVIAGFAGVMVVLQPGGQDLTLGHAAALVAAIGGSLAAIVVRKVGREERDLVLMLYPMFGNFILMGAVLGFIYEPMPALHLGGMFVIALFGFTAGLILIAAYKNAEAAIVAPMQYSQIIWATAYGMIFFDESLDRATAAGAGIIIASGLYIVLRESRGKSKNTPVLRTRTRGYSPANIRISLMLRRWQRRRGNGGNKS